jgi:hypothetical protein
MVAASFETKYPVAAKTRTVTDFKTNFVGSKKLKLDILLTKNPLSKSIEQSLP